MITLTRSLNFLAVGALVGSAVYAYTIKYETMRYQAEIVKARHNIQAETDAIGALRAQWARLDRPDRVQALADQHLDFAPVSVDQYLKPGDLPARSTRVDEIGRKLESLGLADSTATPGPATDAARASVTPSKVR
jgi:cell division protein FtsL